MLLTLSGCSKASKLNPDDPVTLTMWHVYGSQTESPLNDSINEFNRTVGKEKGIVINVVSVSSSSAIDEALTAAAKGTPGVPALPDLFTAYPRVAEIIGYDNLLNWNDYFTEQELSAFVDEFIEEGYFKDKLLMLPVAKSTELLFLNQTLFEQYSDGFLETLLAASEHYGNQSCVRSVGHSQYTVVLMQFIHNYLRQIISHFESKWL